MATPRRCRSLRARLSSNRVSPKTSKLKKLTVLFIITYKKLVKNLIKIKGDSKITDNFTLATEGNAVETGRSPLGVASNEQEVTVEDVFNGPAIGDFLAVRDCPNVITQVCKSDGGRRAWFGPILKNMCGRPYASDRPHHAALACETCSLSPDLKVLLAIGLDRRALNKPLEDGVQALPPLPETHYH